MRKLKILVIGLGRIGKIHLNNLLAREEVEIIGICDPTNEARVISNKIGVKFYQNDFADIASEVQADAIVICSPTDTHANYVSLAAKKGIDVFCEKPLDLNINKIVKTFKKVKKNNSKIQIGFNRRFDPSHHSIKKDLEKGKIGRLEKIIITSRDPAPSSKTYLRSSGGIFRDMMIHDFDLCRYYLNKDEISEISSSVSSFENFYKKIKDHELATVTMKSKKGVICVITNSRHCSFGYDERVELFGKKGMLLSGNHKNTAIELFNSNQSIHKNPF